MRTAVDRTEAQREALNRATTSQALSNLPTIYAGFTAKGIPEADILPRENVFTFEAWRALGRTVRRGEHGVRITTWIPCTRTDRQPDGTDRITAYRRPKTAVVFHVSQTEPWGKGKS